MTDYSTSLAQERQASLAQRVSAAAAESGARRVVTGMLGSSFMGRAHSRALALLPTLESTPAAVADLRAICGRDQARLDDIARRFGWQQTLTDWHALVEDPELDAFINTATNDLHAEPCIKAARNGKHVLCEKPLARSAGEALEMLEAAETAGVVHMCAFNYRFFPAIRLGRELIDSGKLGEIIHFRSRFLLPTAADPHNEETAWRLQRASAGSGVVGDLLAHHIDLARYLVGEISAVTATTRTGQSNRQGIRVDVEDAAACTVEFDRGAIGTLEASRMTPGHVLDSIVEVDGTAGSMTFDVRRPNELVLASPAGANTLSVTDPEQPYLSLWWPRGHGIGWGDSFVHELRHFVGAVAGAWAVAPHGATFYDGYRCAMVCDAIIAAADRGSRHTIACDKSRREQS